MERASRVPPQPPPPRFDGWRMVGVAFVVVTLWESHDAIHRFAGEDIGLAVVAPEARALLIEWESTVEHYEVVTS